MAWIDDDERWGLFDLSFVVVVDAHPIFHCPNRRLDDDPSLRITSPMPASSRSQDLRYLNSVCR